MAFKFFKKKKKKEEQPHYDPLNIKITDIRVGFFLDYNLKTWEVTEEYEYDWGDDFFSYEFKLVTGDEVCFLSIDTEDDLTLTVTKKVKLSKIDPELIDRLVKKGKPPKKLDFEGIRYYRESESAGFYRNTATTAAEKSVEMITWDFYDEDEKRVINIEQWEAKDFEAAAGVVAQEFEFSNITPSSPV